MRRNLIPTYFLFLLLLLTFQIYSQQELAPEQIYEKVNNSVVIVLAYDSEGNQFNQGSGVVIDEEGYIITNYHIMKNASKASVVHSNLFENAELIGGDEESDILFIKISKSYLSAIDSPESDEVKIGQKIYAIGSPMGYENTISDGIVSGYRKFDKMNLIQITASISPGSSGGAVVNSKGELIGISTYTISEGQNINFAIPIGVIGEIEIKPFVFKQTKPVDAKIEKIETENNIKIAQIHNKSYNPKAVEYFNKGKELNSKAYDQNKKKDKLNFYRQAIQNFDNAIRNDSNLVGAYYQAGEILASEFKLNAFNEAIKYFYKVENFIINSNGDICDSISNREMLVQIAKEYTFQNENVEKNILTAIRLYKEALFQPLPNNAPTYLKLDDHEIYYLISGANKQIANYISNSENDYYKAKVFYDSALEFSRKLGINYIWNLENIIIDDKVAYQRYINYEWRPFRIICKGLFKQVNILIDCKPLVGKDILYMYHPNSLIKEKNGMVRVWVKEVNLKGKTEREANEYDYLKSLFEFDLKNKKFRVLQQSTQYSSEVITSDNFPKAEWQFVSPETIAETMVENLRIITK